ncbi:hypothetical protein I4U23_005346 [Adineta vaga]|nr:hypothetical protein I4U23_005346 [Adineta vaga]
MDEFYNYGKSVGQLNEDGTFIEKIIIINEKIVALNIVLDALVNLKTLKHFVIYFTPIKETTKQFSTLTNLEIITFCNCSLTHLPHLNKLHQLEFLNIPNNSLTQLDELLNANLIILEISSNNFTQIPILKNKENLIFFFSASNPLKNAESILLYPNLQPIDLHDTTLMSIPSDIDKLHQLERLLINDNQLTDLPLGIFNLSKIYFLDAHNNLFSAENIDSFEEKMKQCLPTAYLYI